MLVSVDVPDPIAVQLHLDGENGRRRALEMLVLEGCRAGKLSRGQVSELLGLEFNETERFLKSRGCAHGLSVEQHEEGVGNLERLLSR